MGSKHKRVFFVIISLVFLASIVLSVGAVRWRIYESRNRGAMMYGNGDFQQGFGGMMNRGKYNYQVPVLNDRNQFILPEDALKSGELAVVVSDLEVAKKAMLDIAEKSKGSVYKTYISYASDNVKNGSIVVQVPAENFDSVFDGLKKIGSQVVQESTEQVAPRSFYPVPMIAEDKTVSIQDSEVEDSAGSEAEAITSTEEKPEIATYPAPNPIQVSQNKGYVKIIFVDYSSRVGKEEKRDEQKFSGNILGIGSSDNQGMRNNLVVIIGIKLILLVAIFGLLIVIFKKIFNRIKVRKENKKRVHVVRMMPKTRSRVVRIQKRK